MNPSSATRTLNDTTPSPIVKSTGAARQLPFVLGIFFAAFLLFQAELLLGKQILPLFGGAPAVWTVCLLVFQLLFLAGYGYSHALATRVPLRRQFMVHGALLGLSVAILVFLGHLWPTPISPSGNWGLHDADPTWVIVKFLICAIGLPFFLLSTTSPLLQHWFAKAGAGQSPYRLYAVSNMGSLLGLLSYPFLVEPYLHLHAQGWIWTAGYALFLICFYFSARSVARAPDSGIDKQGSVTGVASGAAGWRLRLLWITLAACASILLLATTNLICQNVAVIPFLWVLPLSLYLLSFIICFESDRWYRRGIFTSLSALAVPLVILVTLPNTSYSFLAQLAAYSVVLFAGCMACHGEAARSRLGVESLTAFYFCIAIGGALGGIFVSLVAPRIFLNYWEYPLAILACVALLLSLSRQDPSSWWYTGKTWLALLILAGVAAFAPVLLAAIWSGPAPLFRRIGGGLAAALVIAAGFYYMKARKTTAGSSPTLIRGASRIVLALLTAGLVIPQKAEFYHVIAQSRNFYGVLSVVSIDAENYLALRHGNIVHGIQYRDPKRARLTTGYYGPGSGANIVISNWRRHPMRVGLVGMGAGTLAALAQPGDVYRFYEINPDVYKWSSGEHPYFTFLRDSPAHVEVVLGDGRLSLEREASLGEFQKFDVLVLDAFSGDAIPMHLLTHEAFSIYEKHLRSPSSVIAVHISNQALDLRPVLAGISREFGFHALRFFPLLVNGPLSQSDWILLSRDPVSLSDGELVKSAEPFPGPVQPIYWTDDYCNLFRVMRWKINDCC